MKILKYFIISYILFTLPVIASELKPGQVDQLLFQLSASNKTSDNGLNLLLEKWEQHIVEVTSNLNREHINVLKQLSKDYYNITYKLNNCVSEYEKEQKKYSPIWVSNLKNKFGNEYVIKNKDNIIKCLLALNTMNYYHFCYDIAKEATYVESQQFMAYKNYINLFFDFISTLDEKKQKKLENRKKLAQTTLSVMLERPLTQLTPHSYSYMLLDETVKRDVDPELYLHLKQSPILSKPFDAMVAAKDLQK